MRLIDADAFIEDIKTEIVNLALDGLKGTPRPREELYQIIDRINEQPIAYDVEKVVEQLEETGKRVCVSVHCNDKCQNCEHGVLMCSLLDIVRNGGKE